MFDLGMTAEQAAERTGVAIDVVRKVRARADAVAWKHTVPHALG